MDIDISRLVVIIWLYLPALVYLTYRLWYGNRTYKYPTTQVARVTLASNSKGILGGSGGTNLTYVYRVMGIEYEQTAYIEGRPHKLGDEIPIRYNPSQPGQSIIWKPMKQMDWVLLGLMWLAITLGSTFFSMLIGVFPSVLLTIQFRKVREALKASGVPFGLMVFICIACLLLAVGAISLLIEAGFWNQNLLWELWNHKPLFSGFYAPGGLSKPEVGVGKVIDPMIIVEAILALLLGAAGGLLFSALRKKTNFWLAFILVAIIFLAIIFAYIYFRTDYFAALFI